MERKLASIQRIVALDPIPGADAIEKATILGWEVVVAKKDNFKVEDPIVYCEVDSILPDKPEFEFLRERKFRIRTIKLKGQVSQGIVFPLTVLPKGNYTEGQDVTETLGVRKHDPQAEFERKEAERLASIDKNRMSKFLKRYSWYRKLVFKLTSAFLKPTKVPFPSFIRKTDEDRIQLFPDYYERWGNLPFTITEKLDGQSATYFCISNPKRGLFRKKWLFGVCSRNFQLLKPDNSSYWTLARELRIEQNMTDWCKLNNRSLIVQGEAVGRGIQGNKYALDNVRLFVFNVYVYDKGRTESLDQTDQVIVCSYLQLEWVSQLERGARLLPTIPEMVNSAKGRSILNTMVLREGIVVRNYENHVSFKVINPDFLLKYQE